MWGCLLGPEKLEAEWRTGAALLCPARKLQPVGSAWPSPWPCGRPAATPACASTPCLWSSWKQKLGSLLEWRPHCRMVPAIVSGLVAVPGSFGHRKCSGGGWAGSFGRRKWSGGGPMGSFTGLGGSGGIHLALGFIRGALGSRGGVVARLVKSMPPTGGGSGGVLGPGGGVSGTWRPWCVGGRLWSVRGSGWDGGWLHRGGATGRVLELGRCWRCWFLGGGCCFSGWRGFAGQLRGLDLEDSCAWLRAAGPGTGSEGDWGTEECGWGSLNVHSSGGCGRGWKRKWRAGGDGGENRWLEAGRWCHRRGSSRWRGLAPGAGRGGTPVELGLAAAAGRGGTPVLGLVGIGLAQGRGWLGGWGLGG